MCLTRNSFMLAVLCGAGALSFCGCDSASDRTVVRVSGTVTLDGQPLPEGQIRFVPIEGTSGPTSGATIQQGDYRVTNRGGVPPGQHRVEIRALRPNQQGHKASDTTPGYEAGELLHEQYLPARYNSASELTASVPADVRRFEQDFELRQEVAP